MAEASKKLKKALFALRLGVFSVMLVWSLDKFSNPEHAAVVFQNFYFSPSFGPSAFYVIGAVELMITIGFLLGIQKRLTYGAVFLLHLISTLSSYKQYLQMELLFFALDRLKIILLFRK